jgi:hypothetical protein
MSRLSRRIDTQIGTFLRASAGLRLTRACNQNHIHDRPVGAWRAASSIRFRLGLSTGPVALSHADLANTSLVNEDGTIVDCELRGDFAYRPSGDRDYRSTRFANVDNFDTLRRYV